MFSNSAAMSHTAPAAEQFITYQINTGAANATVPEMVKHKMPLLHGEYSCLNWLGWKKEWLDLIEAKLWDDLPQAQQARVKHNNLKLLLKDRAKNAYVNAVTISMAARRNMSLDDVEAGMEAVEELFVHPASRETILDLMSEPKVRGTTVAHHAARFTEYLSKILLLPAPMNGPVEDVDLSRMFKRSMPRSWQTIYGINSFRQVDTLTELIQFFSEIERREPRESQDTNSYRNTNRSNGNGRFGANARNGGNARFGGNGGNNRNGNARNGGNNNRNANNGGGNGNQRNNNGGANNRNGNGGFNNRNGNGNNRNGNIQDLCRNHPNGSHTNAQCNQNRNNGNNGGNGNGRNQNGNRNNGQNQNNNQGNNYQLTREVNEADVIDQFMCHFAIEATEEEIEAQTTLKPVKMCKEQKSSVITDIFFQAETISHGKSSVATMEIFVKFGEEGKSVKALIDTGANKSLIQSKYVPVDAILERSSITFQTGSGKLKSEQKMVMKYQLPQFTSHRVAESEFHLIESLSYPIILGTDFLLQFGFNLNFQKRTLEWDEIEIPMAKVSESMEKDIGVLNATHAYNQEPESIQELQSRSIGIKDAHYVDYTAEQLLENVDEEIKKPLLKIMKRNEDLFSGGLGLQSGKEYHIPIAPDAKPQSQKAFPIAKIYEETTRKEIDRLVKLGVLTPDNKSPWAAPTMIIPKKDGSVRLVTDFRRLNQFLERRPYPVPKITDMLYSLGRPQWFSALDLSMGYYTTPLDEESSLLTAFVVPWGKYRYLRLPMGISTAVEEFHSRMNMMYASMPQVHVYLDDIFAWTDRRVHSSA